MEGIAGFLKVLADPTRLRILHALQGGERCVSDLLAELPCTQANVSKHLQQLCTAGFISRRKEGTFAYYALADDEVFALCDTMCGRIEAEHQAKRAALRLTR